MYLQPIVPFSQLDEKVQFLYEFAAKLPKRLVARAPDLVHEETAAQYGVGFVTVGHVREGTRETLYIDHTAIPVFAVTKWGGLWGAYVAESAAAREAIDLILACPNGENFY